MVGLALRARTPAEAQTTSTRAGARDEGLRQTEFDLRGQLFRYGTTTARRRGIGSSRPSSLADACNSVDAATVKTEFFSRSGQV
jgi:hypothetical protein